jgi:hypothetical protein
MNKSKHSQEEKFSWNKGDVDVSFPDNEDDQQPDNPQSPSNKKEALKKALEILNHLVSDIGSDED